MGLGEKDIICGQTKGEHPVWYKLTSMGLGPPKGNADSSWITRMPCTEWGHVFCKWNFQIM